MLVLITGGRKYKDAPYLYSVLDRINLERRFTYLVHGAAAGADTLANEWCHAAGVQPVAMEALWDAEDLGAGTRRNKRMWDLFKPELVIAFPGGRGTANMMKIAYDGGAELIDVEDISLSDLNPIVGVKK